MSYEALTDSFFLRVIKDSEKEISKRKLILQKNQLEHEARISELTEQLEDARADVDNAFLQVPEDRIKTNALQVEFMPEYLAAIERTEVAVEHIEEAIELTNERYTESVEKIEAEISVLEDRVKRFNS